MLKLRQSLYLKRCKEFFYLVKFKKNTLKIQKDLRNELNFLIYSKNLTR